MARLEFETPAKLRRHLKRSTDLTGAAFQGLDLVELAPALRGATPRHNILLGCRFDSRVFGRFEQPIVFPQIKGLPFKPVRAKLYTPEELFRGYVVGKPKTYRRTVDGRTYEHYVRTGKAHSTDVFEMLARRLHDHSITDAMQEFLGDRKVVAIMGGHSLLRSDPIYLEVARLARELTRAGYLVTTGGGPGAMEAGHLGAWFTQRTDRELVAAVKLLSTAPLYDPIDDWIDTAQRVVKKDPLKSPAKSISLGIPTWLYGHEPPSCFATHIAKYFANSVREEGLLAIANHGVVFAPGSAGTIQEVFQDAAQNHYKSFGHASPMVFLGEQYWKSTKPVYPLLANLAAGHEYARWLTITDSRERVMRWIQAFEPPQETES